MQRNGVSMELLSALSLPVSAAYQIAAMAKEQLNVNAILPIQPAPLVGMQGWYVTVCSIWKI